MKKSYLMGFLTVLIWSTMAATVKRLLSDIPNMEALFLSSVFASAFLLIRNLAGGHLKKEKRPDRRQVIRIVILGFIGLFLYSALYYVGLDVLTSQEACVLNYLWPVMIVLFSSVILREKMTVTKAAALACSFAGIVILTSGDIAGGGGTKLPAAFCCIIAAVCYGLFSVLNKKLDYDQNIAMMIIWMTTACCSMISGVITGGWVPVRGFSWFGILWLGVGSNAIGYLLWAVALREAKNTAVIANLAYLTPFLSIVFSAIFLKEPVRARTLLAAVFIVGGILVQSIVGQPEIRNKLWKRDCGDTVNRI